MPDNVDPAVLVDLLESRSSVLYKVPDEHRRLMNEALIERPPRSYRAIYKAFRLKDFWRELHLLLLLWATCPSSGRCHRQHRVRHPRWSVEQGRRLNGSGNGPSQTLDALTDPDVSSNVIHRLLGAWRLIGRIGER